MAKKNIIGLSTLLLVLLLGLFTTSYASFTESEIKNLYYNGLRQLGGKTEQQAKDLVDIVDFSNLMKYGNNSQYVNLSGYFNNDSYTYYCFYYNGGNNSKYLYVYVCSTNQYVRSNETASQNKKITNSNISALMEFYVANPNPSPNVRARGRVGGQNLSQTWTECYSPVKPITYYNNDNNIIWSAPIQTSNWLTPSGPYTDFTPYWVFARTGDTDIRIEGFTPTIRLLSRERINTYLGELVNSAYCKRITATTIAYNKNEGDWNDIITDIDLYNLEMGDIQEVFTTTYHEENEGYYISEIKERSLYLPNNTILMLGFDAKEEYKELYPDDLLGMFEYFYLYDSNTILSGDYLDIDATFNNDFYDDYQQNLEDNYTNIQDDINNENIQNINDTLEEIKEQDQQQDSWWRNKVDELITIESGDINEIINNTFENIKLGSGEIAVDLQIIEYLTNAQPGDFIISWNNYQPNLTIKGVPIRSGDGSIFKNMGYMIPGSQINFSELERNSATLHSVMTWERIIINLGIIMILANQFYLVLLQLFGVATNEFGHNVEEKRILARQQEQEKAKIRSQLWYRNQEKVRDYERLARQKGWKK